MRPRRAFLREQHRGGSVPGIARGPLFQFGGSWWQVGLSFNCNNAAFCGGELGGFWGWAELDRFSDGSITGDAEFAGCGHTTGGGGPR